MTNKDSIFTQINSLKSKQFTGKFTIQTNSNKKRIKWDFYFYLGRLVYAYGGVHPYRSWQRHIHRYLPTVNFQEIPDENLPDMACRNYHYLSYIAQKKIAKREELIAIIESQINEIFFDIVQRENSEKLEYIAETKSITNLLSCNSLDILTLINLEHVLEKAKNDWQEWRKKGLTSWTPDLAPLLKQSEQLQTLIPEVLYQSLLKLMTGKHTIRDLAMKLNKDMLQLTFLLASYLFQGIIELVEVDDFIPLSNNPTPQPLIACIDDSPQISKTMEQIITKAGYQFIGIQEAFQALPVLISKRPDLIFLDVNMPILTGYEVCSQIKRVSSLKEIPIIMLTGKDTIVDRLRAKVVGASAFLPKPLEIDAILKTIETHLQINQNREEQNKIAESISSPTLNHAY